MRTANQGYTSSSSYKPSSKKDTDNPRKGKRDTSADWVTVPRLTVFTLALFIMTIVFNGI